MGDGGGGQGKGGTNVSLAAGLERTSSLDWPRRSRRVSDRERGMRWEGCGGDCDRQQPSVKKGVGQAAGKGQVQGVCTDSDRPEEKRSRCHYSRRPTARIFDALSTTLAASPPLGYLC